MGKAIYPTLVAWELVIDPVKKVIVYFLFAWGGYIKFDAKDVLYDKEHKILQIGKISCGNQTYRFLDNAYIQLKGDNITGLLFTDMEL